MYDGFLQMQKESVLLFYQASLYLSQHTSLFKGLPWVRNGEQTRHNTEDTGCVSKCEANEIQSINTSGVVR